MVNSITDHPLTRRDVLEHIRSIRRTIARARERVGPGPLYEQLSAAMRRCDDAKLSLTKARPLRVRVKRVG